LLDLAKPVQKPYLK